MDGVCAVPPLVSGCLTLDTLGRCCAVFVHGHRDRLCLATDLLEHYVRARPEELDQVDLPSRVSGVHMGTEIIPIRTVT